MRTLEEWLPPHTLSWWIKLETFEETLLMLCCRGGKNYNELSKTIRAIIKTLYST
jgi:hypothetical protein